MQYLHCTRPSLKSLPPAALRCIVPIAALACLPVAGNVNAASPPVAAPISLTTPDRAASARFDFGVRVQNRAAPISTAYVLTNDTGKALTVIALRPSCGCTAALIEGPASALPYRVEPGKTMTVRVNIDTFHLTPGKIDKTVSVTVEGRRDPVAVLEITGSVLPAVVFSKPAIDFGHIDTGGQRSVAVDLTYAAAMETPVTHVDLVSADPEITINPESSGKAAASMQPAEDGAARNRRAFTVTFRPGEHIGSLSSRLTAVLQGGAQTPVTLAELPVSGEVQGEIAASPQVIAFGAVAQGRAGTQQILLTGKDVDHITVSAASAYITAVFSRKPIDASRLNRPFGASTADNAAPNTGERAVLLTVTLSPKTPAGIIESSIAITTAHRQTLRLPVYAVVSSPR